MNDAFLWCGTASASEAGTREKNISAIKMKFIWGDSKYEILLSRK